MQENTQNPFSDLTIISSYSRKQAIEDGCLIDISSDTSWFGIKFPVAVIEALWKGYILPSQIDKDCYNQTETDRLIEMLSVFHKAIRNQEGDTMYFNVDFLISGKHEKTELKAIRMKSVACHSNKVLEQIGMINQYPVAGPDDDSRPIITIMLKGED